MQSYKLNYLLIVHIIGSLCFIVSHVRFLVAHCGQKNHINPIRENQLFHYMSRAKFFEIPFKQCE